MGQACVRGDDADEEDRHRHHRGSAEQLARLTCPVAGVSLKMASGVDNPPPSIFCVEPFTMESGGISDAFSSARLWKGSDATVG
jgi:hypothetical protein